MINLTLERIQLKAEYDIVLAKIASFNEEAIKNGLEPIAVENESDEAGSLKRVLSSMTNSIKSFVTNDLKKLGFECKTSDVYYHPTYKIYAVVEYINGHYKVTF